MEDTTVESEIYPSPKARVIVTKLTKFIVGTSVFWTTKEVIKNNVDPEKKRQQAQAYVGGAALGYMASEASESWIETKVDESFVQWDKLRDWWINEFTTEIPDDPS